MNKSTHGVVTIDIKDRDGCYKQKGVSTVKRKPLNSNLVKLPIFYALILVATWVLLISSRVLSTDSEGV